MLDNKYVFTNINVHTLIFTNDIILQNLFCDLLYVCI